MFPTPYADLNTVLHELVAAAQQILDDNFLGACLHGSFAVGDFDPDSDCDFIVVIKEELSDAHVRALNSMHERIYGLDYTWAQHLEGSYFPKDLLRDYTQSGRPIWYLDHGQRSLERSAHDNTAVVRCQLHDHGIALAGPDPAALVDPIPVAALRHEIVERMRAFRQWALAEHWHINNRFYQAYAVLNYCRMLHDLHTGTVGSKRAGAEWAKATLDPSWADLIDRAWSGRPNPALSVRQPADPQDLARTLEFIEYIIEASTRVAGGKHI
jgi:hypothetical protein